MKHHHIYLTILTSTLLFLASPAYSQIKVELQLSDTTLLLGDEITLQLKVDGTQSNVKVNLPEVNGLNFRQLGRPSSSSQTIIINGKVSSFSGLIYTIGVSADRTGAFDIPGIEVEYDGKSYRSEDFKLYVKEPGQQSKMKLTTETSRAVYYSQEPVTVTLKWYLQDDIEDYGFHFPLLDNKDQLSLKLDDPDKAGPTSDINVDGYKVPFLKTSETVDSEPYTVYSAKFVIVPPSSGPFKIPAASVKAMIREGTELRRDMFGRVVRAPKLKRIFTASSPLNITIKQLPTKDRPTTFTGAVGRFRINTAIETTRVKVGDPVELTIKVTGDGRYEAIEPPLLNEIPEIKENFTVNTNLQPGDIQSDGIVFKQVIRPRNEHITRIPPIKFSFFDPSLERYQTVESNAIPLKVMATGRVKKEDIVVPDSIKPAEVQVFTREGKGIYANYIFEDALTSQTSDWTWIVLLICPPLLYLGILIVVKRRQKLLNDSSMVRFKSAKSVGSKRLKRASKLINGNSDAFYLELAGALRGYISDKLNLGAGEVTAVDIQRLQQEKRIPELYGAKITEILDNLDRLRFTRQEGSQEEHKTLLESVSSLIQDLEKNLK